MPDPGIVFEKSLGVPSSPRPRPWAAANICQTSARVTDSECVVVSASGEFDLGTSRELLATLEEQPWRMARAIVVDLTHVTFCDATVAGALIALAQRADRRGLPVHVVTGSSIIRRCFSVLGVTSVLSTHTDVVAAMTAAACRRAG